jgi:hypothetical protein
MPYDSGSIRAWGATVVQVRLTKKDLTHLRATEGWHARYVDALSSLGGAAPSKRPPRDMY